jgi:effector-binding domain-containing protein
MNILKKIGIGLLSLVILLLVISLFLPSKVKVERSLVMKAPPEAIFAQINTLKNWEQWSAWHKMDPTMALEYEGPAEGLGAKYKWKSEDMGTGELLITASVPSKEIITQLDLQMGKADAKYSIEPTEEGTKVTMTFEGDMGMKPWMKYMGLMMDRMIGKSYDEGLANIQKIVENAPPPAPAPTETEATYKVEETTVTAQPVLTIRAKSTPQELSNKLGEIYSEIIKEMAKTGQKQTSMPFAIYHKWSAEDVDVEAGIPVDKMGKTNGKINATELKAGKVILVKYYGPYEGSEKAHLAIDSYVKANNKKVTGSPWEVYVTDPGVEKDPAKVLTEIYYPIE